MDKATNIVMNYTETESKVREATNDDPWGPSGTNSAVPGTRLPNCMEVPVPDIQPFKIPVPGLRYPARIRI